MKNAAGELPRRVVFHEGYITPKITGRQIIFLIGDEFHFGKFAGQRGPKRCGHCGSVLSVRTGPPAA
jgi:hypothetical protein